MTNDNPLGNEGETTLETKVEKSPEEIQHEQEKLAFSTHIETSDEKVPENFEDAGAWFDSLKEAQKQYTQARQEISDLKTQLPAVEEVKAPVEPTLTNELRIPLPVETPEAEQSPEVSGVDEATYESWGMEFAAKGEFSDLTRDDIKQRTGFSDRMLDDYVLAQKARLRESYSKAANVVGGPDRMDKIFKWASKNLSESDMQGVNIGLSSSTYEVTLRGLASMYDGAVTSQKAGEPKANPNLTQVSASQTGILPYANQREFKKERNDPRFQLEEKYRDIVQRRMAITDWNTLAV